MVAVFEDFPLHLSTNSAFLSVLSSHEEVLSLSLLTRVDTLTGILDFCFS